MQTITTIGFDIAKSVFQVHGVDAEGKVLLRRQLKRRYVLAFFQKLRPMGVLDVPRQATDDHRVNEAVLQLPGLLTGREIQELASRQRSTSC
jgi:transposase